MDNTFVRLIGGFVASAAVATGVFSHDSFNSTNVDLGLQTQAESSADIALDVQLGDKQANQPDQSPTPAPQQNTSQLNVDAAINLGTQAQVNPTTSPAPQPTASPTPVPVQVVNPSPTPASQTTVEADSDATVDVTVPAVSLKFGNTLGVSLGL